MTIVRRINRCAYFRRLACNGAVLLGQNLVAVRLSIKKNFIFCFKRISISVPETSHSVLID